jgi:hypothetical protein
LADSGGAGAGGLAVAAAGRSAGAAPRKLVGAAGRVGLALAAWLAASPGAAARAARTSASAVSFGQGERGRIRRP